MKSLTNEKESRSVKAVSNAVSATIFTGVVISLSIAAMVWARSMSSDYAQSNSEIIDEDIARLKERLAVEYVFYDDDDKILIYLLNCGTIDDVSVKSVRVRNSDSTWTQLFSDLSLELDVGEEGCVTLSGVGALTAGGYYHIKITTVRGVMFESGFVA